MGLDSFWKTETKPAFSRPLHLCGGMFSEHGEDSFRGKVYDDFIFAMTEISLYQEEMSNDDVRKIADKLESLEYDPAWDERFGLTAETFDDLKLMFRGYADVGATLCGWW